MPSLSRIESALDKLAVGLTLALLGAAIPFAQSGQGIPAPPSGSPAGPTAYSCGVAANQANAGRGQQPVFPPDQYPVKLPTVSLLGARNDLPNPYGSGADFGQLPAGRKWGSTASVTTAP